MYGLHSVVDTVVVQFDDGTRCKVHRADEGRLVPQQSGSLFPEDEACPYFPGLVVRAAGQSVFRSARWISGSYRGKMEGVVAAVEPGEVTVDWIAAGRSPHPLSPLGNACVCSLSRRKHRYVLSGTVYWMYRQEQSAHERRVNPPWLGPRCSSPVHVRLTQESNQPVSVCCHAGKFSDASSEPPAVCVPAASLFSLCFYSYTCWQLGDRALYPNPITTGTHTLMSLLITMC